MCRTIFNGLRDEIEITRKSRREKVEQKSFHLLEIFCACETLF